MGNGVLFVVGVEEVRSHLLQSMAQSRWCGCVRWRWRCAICSLHCRCCHCCARNAQIYDADSEGMGNGCNAEDALDADYFAAQYRFMPAKGTQIHSPKPTVKQ